MSDSFGARLREQRERRQLALADLAEQTKISFSLLEGLERDDVSHWPSGIFRRSFVRAYAQLVGLDPEVTVREFLQRHPDPLETVDPALLPIDMEPSNDRPPIRLRYLVGSVMGSLGRGRAVTPKEEARVDDIAANVATPEVILADIDGAGELGELGKPGTNDAPLTQPAPAVAKPSSAPPPAPDLSALARLCTELGQVLETRAVTRVLEAAGELLDASGLIVWIWDARATALKPALSYGYSNELLAKMPGVALDAKNATAAAFRLGETRIVDGSDDANGAVVVPLLTPTGCGGVLAVELRHGGECRESVRALATILAAQLAAFVWTAPIAEAVSA